MLYDRWRQIAQEFSSETALYDLSSNESWTFAQLAQKTEAGPTLDSPLSFPQGISLDFVLSVLRSWRSNKIVCPLEPGKLPPQFESLPPQCIHLKLTSASTGPARVVAFTAEQLFADAENIVQTMHLERETPNLGVISLAHSYGFSNLILPLLLHGVPLAIVRSALPEAVRRASKKFTAITLPAVPALWRAWLGVDAIPRNVRLAISAGAPLPIKLEQEIYKKCGVKVHNFYGASECGGIAYDRSDVPRTDFRFVGEPMRNVQLAVNPSGCLEVTSQAVGQTYWPAGSEILANGKFITSDLADLRDGKVYLSGRATDQINVAGRKVSPEIIETVLLTHPDVTDSLVFGVPSNDAERSETIVACVAVTGPITGETLKQFLLDKLPAWKVPREWWFLDSLKASERGKRSRTEWRENYLKNKSAGDTRFWAR